MPAPNRTVPVNTTIPTGAPPSRQTNKTRMDVVAQKSRSIAMMLAAAAVVVVFAVAGFILYLNKVNETTNGIQPPTPVVPITTSARVNAPTDVKTYLSLLESIEQSRSDLRGGLNTAAMTLIPVPPAPQAPPVATPSPASPTGSSSPSQPGQQASPVGSPGVSTPTPGVSNSQPTQPAMSQPVSSPPPSAGSPAFTAYMQKWQDLIKQLTAQSPPKDCQVLADDYYRLLQDYSAMLSQLSTSSIASTDGITQVEQSSQAQIRSDALVANNALKNLTDSYDMAQPFTIAPELTPPATPATEQ